MQKEVNEQELTLKKRARRRLVGAIALVLLMIIVLPMILKDRAIKQPTEEVTITLSNSKKPQITPEVSEFDSDAVPAEEAPAETDQPYQPSEPDDMIADPEATPAAKPVEPIINEKKAVPKQAEVPKNAVKNSVNAQFYVQIGVFSDEANVKKLQSKLADLGYQSQTEKIDTSKGKKIRLRTHLFKERNEAAIALQNIKDAGLTGMVVSQ